LHSEFPPDIRETSKTLSATHLFKINDEAIKLTKEKVQLFLDEDDHKDLTKVMQFFSNTRNQTE